MSPLPEAGLTSCEACLKRARLLELLAGFIEKVATGAPGSRAAELLARDDLGLAQAVAGGKGKPLVALAAETPAATTRNRIEEAGLWSLCRHDARFPAGLHELGDAPALLTGRGDPSLLERLDPRQCVAIVGSRRATAYGRGVARDLSRRVGAHLVVVSGLANGIDAAAHRGALDGGGLTVAVLGSGADRPYPRQQVRLYDEIAERGLVVSESLPGSEPFRWTFPARNRIMAAMSGMTVVVEAATRSGSLITSNLAGDLGRSVGAVPGPVTAALSAGSNGLLHEGAVVVRDAIDVLDVMLGPGVAELPSGPPLDPTSADLLARLESGAGTVDALASLGGLGPAVVVAGLTRLELLGYVERGPAGDYRRTLLLPS